MGLGQECDIKMSIKYFYERNIYGQLHHTHTVGSINLMKISVPGSMQITPSTMYYLHHRKFLPLNK